MAAEGEEKIPLLTVIKNGAILKNIFVINKPPSPPLVSEESINSSENPDQEIEETLVVGRHPDCNITLTHPSISRFHLQINSNPSSQKLSVTDLSSVHGTWVSGKKIEPGVRVELNEGDTIRVGGSTRSYRLHWVPISSAYDMENPLSVVRDVTMNEEKENDNELPTEENDLHQDENSLPFGNLSGEEEDPLALQVNAAETLEVVQEENPLATENEEIQSLDLICEDMKLLFSDENSEPNMNKEIPSVFPMPENKNSSISDETEDVENPTKCDYESRNALSLFSGSFGFEPIRLSLPDDGVVLETEIQVLEGENQILENRSLTGMYESKIAERFMRCSEHKPELSGNLDSLSIAEAEAPSADAIPGSLWTKDPQNKNTSVLLPASPERELVNTILAVGNVPSENEAQLVNKVNENPAPIFALQSTTERGHQEISNSVVNLNCIRHSEEVDNPTSEALEEVKNQNLSLKEQEQSENLSFYSLPTESVNSCLPLGEVLSEITGNKESQTPESLFAPISHSENKYFESSEIGAETEPNMSSIWSRRGKRASALLIKTARSTRKTVRTCLDTEVELEKPGNVSSDAGEMEEEIFTPDKENITPNTLLLKSFKKKDKLKEINSSPSKFAPSPNNQPEEDRFVCSDKENQAPKVFEQWKLEKLTSKTQMSSEQEIPMTKGRAKREPFQSLHMNTARKSKSEASVTNSAVRSCNSGHCTRTMDKKKLVLDERRRCWNMVVDTTSLLDKVSRETLQLLQGIKGTQLIIPRMVIRELDSLKRRRSILRKQTEVSLVLEWIGKCLEETKWWIHVQSSYEDERLTAPTPPASPRSQLSDGNWGFPYVGVTTTSSVPLSSQSSFVDIVSPTPEDHILDCALQFKKTANNTQLVLLSNDITLKIKAMAEGLICETAQEFRESLMNPFSERFLWADSSPRGLTWSVLDDVVLREKYDRRCPLRISSKVGGSAKGLKLILLHNSHYGQIPRVS